MNYFNAGDHVRINPPVEVAGVEYDRGVIIGSDGSVGKWYAVKLEGYEAMHEYGGTYTVTSWRLTKILPMFLYTDNAAS